MHRTFPRLLAVVAFATALIAPAAALAGSDVTVTLSAQRVSVSQGKESLSPANEVKPGELVEYRAVYTNAGATPARQMLATLPVPAGMELVARTASPAKVEASLDGRTFAPVPLVRRVTQADGRIVTREIPLAEYRALRWPLGTLGPKASRTVTARMRVQSVPIAAATR